MVLVLDHTAHFSPASAFPCSHCQFSTPGFKPSFIPYNFITLASSPRSR